MGQGRSRPRSEHDRTATLLRRGQFLRQAQNDQGAVPLPLSRLGEGGNHGAQSRRQFEVRASPGGRERSRSVHPVHGSADLRPPVRAVLRKRREVRPGGPPGRHVEVRRHPDPRGHRHTHRLLPHGGARVDIRFAVLHRLQVFGIEREHAQRVDGGALFGVRTSIILLHVLVDGDGGLVLYFEGHGKLHPEEDERGGSEEAVYGVGVCGESVRDVLVCESDGIFEVRALFFLEDSEDSSLGELW
mmetsp:Transcript_11982/g.25754  ORF Transcript_11982/g.25754 Transcript_11982/m.25754 type:complete len:244 (-) Transcript_11982:854-1585(-)